ncbi:hypothetical protein VTL71DRAFT_15632, partial [Oculimacula yallundae]
MSRFVQVCNELVRNDEHSQSLVTGEKRFHVCGTRQIRNAILAGKEKDWEDPTAKGVVLLSLIFSFASREFEYGIHAADSLAAQEVTASINAA